MSKLGYIQNMGFDAIWISPVVANLEGDTGDTIDPSVFAGMPNLEPVDAPMQGPRTPPRESPFLLSFWCCV